MRNQGQTSKKMRAPKVGQVAQALQKDRKGCRSQGYTCPGLSSPDLCTLWSAEAMHLSSQVPGDKPELVRGSLMGACGQELT